jgi:hypothetical protein
MIPSKVEMQLKQRVTTAAYLLPHGSEAQELHLHVHAGQRNG